MQYGNFSFAVLACVHKHYFGQTQLDVTGAYRLGTPGSPHKAILPICPATAPGLDYQLKNIDATLNTPLQASKRPMSCNRNIPCADMQLGFICIGMVHDRQSLDVCGFDGENTLAAEKGFVLRNEVDIPKSIFPLPTRHNWPILALSSAKSTAPIRAISSATSWRVALSGCAAS